LNFLNKVLDIFTGTLQGNFWLIIFLFMVGVIRLYQAFGSTKMEEYEGHKVISIHSMDMWTKTLKENQDALIVVDFFATWCPPCRRASPIFGRWSTEFGNVVFLKVDVDIAGDVAKKNGITGMPTFKLFKNGTVVDQVIGWDEGRIHALIEKHKVTNPSSVVGDITRRK